MRVVYSFSVPDNSIAHWQLKKWKAEGINISAHLLKLIEGDGSKVLELEAKIEAQERKLRHQGKVLSHIMIYNPTIEMPTGFDEAVKGDNPPELGGL